MDPDTLDGSDGFVFNASDGHGRPVAVAGGGDVNGDGVADVVIGVPRASPTFFYEGQTFVLFGHTNPFAPRIELTGLDGTNGYVINGYDDPDELESGRSVAIGNFNNDGIDDILIGTDNEAHVFFGRSDISTAEIDLADALRLFDDAGFSYDGRRVGNGGDINGDGLDDVLVGVPDQSAGISYYAGISYVFPGPLSGGSTFSVKLIGSDANFSGSNVAGAGDINGDGVGDLIVVSAQSPSYVVFGRRDGTIPGIDIRGTAGRDSLEGTAGNDTIDALGGNDTVYGDAGNDVVLGGNGDDNVAGGDGNDTLNGEGGEDRLDGGAGNDRLIGGTSFDTLTGGDGADRFYFAPDHTIAALAPDADVITDFSVVEGDKINLVRFTLPDFAALQALFVAAGADTLIDLTTRGGRDILIENVTLAELDNGANFVL